MKLLGLLFISFFLFCCQNQSLYKSTNEEIERQAHIDAIRKKVAFQMKDEYGLIPCGIGGRTSNGIEMLALSFDLRRQVSIDKGRELIVKAVQQLVIGINEDEILQPHLINIPFEPKNVEISIVLWKPDGSDSVPGELFIIQAAGGFITYYSENIKKGPFRIMHKESFEEALRHLEDNS